MAKQQTHATPMRKAKTEQNKTMSKGKSVGGGKRPSKPAKASDATSINPKKEEPITPDTPVMHPA